MQSSPAPAHRLWPARLGHVLTGHLRYQIVVPYLLLATIFALSGTYLLMHSASQSLHDRFNQQLLDAARAGADSLVQAETQQLAGLRLMIYSEGLPDAIIRRDHDLLRSRIEPLALNSGFDYVRVLAPDGTVLLELHQPTTASPQTGLDMAVLTPALLHPSGALDKVSAVRDTPQGRVFITGGPVRQDTQVVGTILVGTYLPHLLHQVARDSLSDAAVFYGADGAALGQALTSTGSGNAVPSPLLAGWYADIQAHPDAPPRYRTITLGGAPYIEALGSVPGGGVGGTPGVYGVLLSGRALDGGLQDSLWALLPLFALGLVLIIGIGSALAARIDRPVTQLVAAANQVARGNLGVQVPVTRHDELGVLATRFNDMVTGLRQLLVVKDLFGRFVSPEVSRQLLAGQIKLGGEQRTVTILFSDLRDFTQLSEQYPPEAIVDLLNEYFRAVVQAAHRHGGTVNKFGGDSTLIIFGAPVEMPDHADRALATALEMRTAMEALNEHRSQEGWDLLRQGIGLNTGRVVAGQIGSEDRMEYTVIGDPVNLAARIQGLSKLMPGCDIVFSETTRAALTDPGAWRWADQGLVDVRGKQEPVQVYSLLGTGSSLPDAAPPAPPTAARSGRRSVRRAERSR